MYDPRNEFISSGFTQCFDDRTVHVAIIEPIKATIDELYHTLWTLCGGGQSVVLYENTPIFAKNELGGIGERTNLISRTLHAYRLFVEQDAIREKTTVFNKKRKMCLSLRMVSFAADRPDGTRERHSYPDPPLYTEFPREHPKPSGQVMIAMIVYQYDKKRHRLLLAPIGGGPSVMDFWQQLVSEFKRIYPKATVATAITPPVTSKDRQRAIVEAKQPADQKAPGNRVLPATVRRYHQLAKTTTMSANSIREQLKTDTVTYYQYCEKYTGEAAIVMSDRNKLIRKKQWPARE